VASGAPSWIDFVRFGISTTFDAGGGTADGFGSIDGDGGSVRGGGVRRLGLALDFGSTACADRRWRDRHVPSKFHASSKPRRPAIATGR